MRSFVRVQSTIQKLMPPPLNTRAFVIGTDVKHHAVTDIDPVQSFNANKVFLLQVLEHVNSANLAVYTVPGAIALECLAAHASKGNVNVSTTSCVSKTRDKSQSFECMSELLHRLLLVVERFLGHPWCHDQIFSQLSDEIGLLLLSYGAYLSHHPAEHSNTLCLVKHRHTCRHSHFASIRHVEERTSASNVPFNIFVCFLLPLLALFC